MGRTLLSLENVPKIAPEPVRRGQDAPLTSTITLGMRISSVAHILEESKISRPMVKTRVGQLVSRSKGPLLVLDLKEVK